MEQNFSDEMLSLNQELNSEFFVEELEKRLETNPLSFFVDFPTPETDGNCFTCHLCFSCGDFSL